ARPLHLRCPPDLMGAAGGSRVCVADRMRERGEFIAGARVGPAERNSRAARAWRGALADRSAAVERERIAGGLERAGRVAVRRLDAGRAAETRARRGCAA